MAAKAGEGEYRCYTFQPGGDDGPLLPNQHYLSVDAVAWFLNREDGWFSKWTASGTLEISLVGGLERYQAALGAFELHGSARTAPVFDRPVLPDRNYRGGPISLCVSLFALRRDTALAGLLKSASSASLGIVAGMVETASLAGPHLVLGAAAASLIGGVSELLTTSPGGTEHLLGQGGLEVALAPEQVRGPLTYVLFHRGTRLDPGRLAVGTSAALTYPLHDGQELADGAWVLLRLRRSASYSGVRGWFDKERALRAAVQNLVDDVRAGAIDAAEALPRLRPGAGGSETLFDELRALRQIIQLDGAIHEAEARLRVAGMVKAFADARAAIERTAFPVRSAFESREANARFLEAPAQERGAVTDFSSLAHESLESIRSRSALAGPGSAAAPEPTANADLLREQESVAEARRAARPVEDKVGRIHALLIGIDAYPGPNPAPLLGCVNDIDDIERVLVDRLGVARSDIRRLASPREGAAGGASVAALPATHHNIVAALRALGGDAVGPDDRVFIHYSGHGTSIEATGARGVALREALVPVDARLDEQGTPRNLLFDVQLNELLRKIAERTRRVTVILDCCHSTGATRDGFSRGSDRDQARSMRVAGRFPAAALGLPAELPAGHARGGSVVHGLAASVESCAAVAACLADESALEGAHSDGRRGGYFTRALVAQLAAIPDAELPELRWGRIWRQLEANVESKRRQHPRLLGSFARKVFGGPPEDGDPGFGVRLDGAVYHLSAGELAGVTEGALVAVYGSQPALLPLEAGSKEELAVRQGTLKVTRARRSSAEAMATEGRSPFALPPGARARVIDPGRGAALIVAVEPAVPDLLKAISASPSLRLAEGEEAPAVILKRCSSGAWAVIDDQHGDGETPDEPVLIRIPDDKALTLAPKILEHYRRYIAPVEMARRCTDLPAGTLTLGLLDCSDKELDEHGILIDPEIDPHNLDLDPLLPDARGVYDLRDRRSAFCIEVRSSHARPLYVTLLESGASGRVSLLAAHVTVPPQGRHVFWLESTPKRVASVEVPPDRSVIIDRIVAIGTTERGKDLRFLAWDTAFADVMEPATLRDVASLARANRYPPLERWTADQIILRTSRGQG
ncbi:caspase family protein [Sorangium sp. KYC3313]|uniref:caspase family protein n=1 Tax=Sorangium sp. KYC3313 TaxID=3449740 RepID=UPI003F890AAF